MIEEVYGMDLSMFEAITEPSLNAMLVIDEQGIIQASNRAVLQNFGFTQEELLGRNVSLLMPKSYAEAHDGYLESYGRTKERKIIGTGREVIGQRKDGSTFPMNLTVSEFQLEGQRAFIGVCYDISERFRLTERIMQLVTYDDLTGCLNRPRFVQSLKDHLQKSAETGGKLALLFIDLDGFKQINDSYGHLVGDRLLRQVAERLRGGLRAIDTLGRVGGDEFVVFIRLKKGDNPEVCAQRLIRGLMELFSIDGVPVQVSASIGVSLFPEHGQSAEELMSSADIAMYRSKESGGGTVCVFDMKMREENERIYRLALDLRKALALGGQFELHYQLQFDLRTYEPCGIEALLRWRDVGALIPPAQFIPVARKYGLMPTITQWVISQACKDNSWLIELGVLDVPVAVNVCVDSFVDEGFALRVEQLLHDSGLPSARLELEVTEDVAMRASVVVLSNAQALRSLGISLAMDDFGVGYSSLGRLKSLQFQKLKIDRSFVDKLPGSEPDKEIIRATLAIARSLEMNVVAEGIETEEQLAFLQAEGCSEGQGYWFARPMPLDSLIEWIENWRAV